MFKPLRLCNITKKSLQILFSKNDDSDIMCDRRLQQSGSTDTQLLTNESTNPPVTRLGERFNFKNQSIALLVYRSTNGTVSSFFPSNGNIVIILRDFNINTTAVNVSRTLKYCF